MPNLKLLTSAVAQILKGTNPKFLGAPIAQDHVHFFVGVDCGIFMMGFGKPQQCANFEVASISRCRNFIGNPKIWGASHTYFSFWV